MPVTTNRDDPGLREIDPTTGMQKSYIVLSVEERRKGFIRPLRDVYKHDKCGSQTTMGSAIAETYARNPKFYGGTYCATCRDHFPVAEFHWLDGEVLGS